jgi:molybdopterin molybdotransferase
LPAVRLPLSQAFGRVLQETVGAATDLPPFDCSARDGYAVLLDDVATDFQVVDTIPAGGWKPRQLRSGEAVRVATGAPLPCGGLRVVMQENVERQDDQMWIVRREDAANIRLRGEEVKAAQPLVMTNTVLSAGAAALLATAGCVHPLVSPRLRIRHFTTGDEVVSPDQSPEPGQIRDSNSILVQGLLRRFPCDLEQEHLPEDFAGAWARLDLDRLATADMVLISGGASVGDKDFTRPLLERLGFEIIFSQVNIRPGRPLIFGVSGARVAFGLPGNPLAHFVCFHFAVATALARLTGDKAPEFLRGRLAEPLDDPAGPRETLSPARLNFSGDALRLHPLAWTSSGDVMCFAQANALVRKPANCGPLEAGAAVDFLPITGMLCG